jgi:hypothetical protein
MNKSKLGIMHALLSAVGLALSIKYKELSTHDIMYFRKEGS